MAGRLGHLKGRSNQISSRPLEWYDDFRQTTDNEVSTLMHESSAEPAEKGQ